MPSQSTKKVETPLAKAAAALEALGGDAVKGEWPDIAREATTLKQQLLTARNKILLAQRDVAGRTPS